MYICPTCKQYFETEEQITSHSLKCWREHHPNHKSKPAPQHEDRIYYAMNEDIANFFEFFTERNQ